ncbi:cyclic nucleotide-binding domain-containing protein [Thalassococcus sp. S3]|uniref:cyclic nucleotide-binding domain-containing protein n=1 Tax=Thalassococcus sp. S3 TaxID=2017482 RepID=UPI00102429DF|nr:cyclic nucleotide-binding domain-containing protein [Thalassococcus sp. S3]QBF33454.1 hypothetical protein CFI11_19890 [Thalassococcus sp. S3]
MPIRIRLAQDEQDIEQVFRIRHQVFREEEDLIHADGTQVVLDQFDAFPASKLFVALNERDQIVGSVRATLDNPAGLPADEYFDFREHTPPASRFMSISMYCVARPYRNLMVARGLLLMCTYHALANNVDYISAPLNPVVGKLIHRIGGKPVTNDLLSVPHINVRFLPYLLDMNDLHETFANFAKQNVAHNMIRSYECMIFKKGERIIRKGDPGDCAYLIVTGAAQVLHPNTSAPIAELSQGDVFGDRELLSGDTMRTADVFASSLVRVMVLPKRAFLEHQRTLPRTSVDPLKTALIE